MTTLLMTDMPDEICMFPVDLPMAELSPIQGYSKAKMMP